MRRNVTIGLSPSEFIRVQGAAAVANMPVATYLKWLLRGGAPHDDIASGIEHVLKRVEDIAIAIARLPRYPQISRASLPADASAAPTEPASASREQIERALRDRGIPTSTIRQLLIVLDELRVVR